MTVLHCQLDLQLLCWWLRTGAPMNHTCTLKAQVGAKLALAHCISVMRVACLLAALTPLPQGHWHYMPHQLLLRTHCAALQ